MSNIIAITGPSGAGKTTLGELIKERLDFYIPKHTTTRQPRKDDIKGFYRYLKHDEYNNLFINNEFLLSSGDSKIITKNNGNFYGILYSDVNKLLENNKNIIIFVSYKDINRLIELKQQEYKIEIINLKFRNIKKTMTKRIVSDNRNHTKKDIENRIKSAINDKKIYGDLVEKHSAINLYTDNIGVEEVFNKVCDVLNLIPTYYIGFAANNAICNENFFDGSITLYPTNEKGNIYYSDKYIKDTSSEKFIKKYKKYIDNEIKKLPKYSRYIIFNQKIADICSDIDNKNFVYYKNYDLINFLNNKFSIREYLKKYNIPMLDYFWLKGDEIKYINLKQKIKNNVFVLQGSTGAGGNTTYLIKNQNDIKKINLNKNEKYCVSNYIPNTPLNITIIIGKYNNLYFPISAQLISVLDSKFKYVGGDFIYPNQLNKKINKKILKYSKKIVKKIKKLGYFGILGIDFILTKDGKIKFMEINPRFQSSSFLINLYLNNNNTCLAELHCMAINEKKLKKIKLEKIDNSFLNCNFKNSYNDISSNQFVKNGYFNKNEESIYRKIYNYSIIYNHNFEVIDKNLQKK